MDRWLSINRSGSGGLRLWSPMKGAGRLKSKATLQKGSNHNQEVEYKKVCGSLALPNDRIGNYPPLNL